MADVHGSTVTASVLALPDFFTSHASTERVLTSVLEDTRGARGEEIRQGQRQGRMADNSVDMGADMGAVAPSHAWERGAPDPAPMPWERRSHVHGSTAPMHGRGAPMRVERCSHEYGTLCSHDGSIAPMPMGGGAPMHGRSAPMHGSIAPMHGRGCSHGWEGVLPSMGALCSHAWERCSHGHGSRVPMTWEQVQNVGEALPWGADMGALLDPLPCMGGGLP